MKRESIVILVILLVLQLYGSLSALPTTAFEAEMIVQGWLKTDFQPLGTDIGQDVREVEIFSDDNDEPLYYVVYLDPSGFVIVSADDEIEPIIGFSDDGTYDPSPDNPLFALVTNDLNGRMATSQNSFSLMAVTPQSQVNNTQKKWNYLLAIAEASGSDFRLMGLKRISDVWVAPLIQSKWDQETVCNELCYNFWTPNNYPSGCVATAMAQLMRFYRYPFLPEDSVPNSIFERQSFTITVNGNKETRYLKGGNGFGGLYKWDLMDLVPDCDTSLAERQAIGALCYDAGISINTDYTADNSGALLNKAKEALLSTFKYENAINGWKYDSNTQTFRDLGPELRDMINPNLDAGHPVILSLRRKGSDGGHAVLADGYGYNFSTLYHHLNMGWSGNHDIYYNLPNVDSEPPYDVIDGCIYNIFTSGKGEIISGRVTDESGNPIRGARVTAIEHINRRFVNSYSEVTNDMGIYALTGLDSYDMNTLNNIYYIVSVSKAGYNFGSKTVRIGRSSDGGSVSGNKWGINFMATSFSPDSSLVGWWKLDEGSGNTAIDVYGNNGTIHNANNGGLGNSGSVWINDPERGMVVSFNGDDNTGAYISTEFIIPAMNMTNDFTWAFWAKQDNGQATDNDVILGNRYGGTTSPLQFIKFTPKRFEFFNNDFNYQEGINYKAIPNGKWIHHAVVKDGTSLIYYRNGDVAGTSTITKTIDENPFYMGGNSNKEHWRGYLSDVRLYDKALTEAEIREL